MITNNQEKALSILSDLEVGVIEMRILFQESEGNDSPGKTLFKFINTQLVMAKNIITLNSEQMEENYYKAINEGFEGFRKEGVDEWIIEKWMLVFKNKIINSRDIEQMLFDVSENLEQKKRQKEAS